MLDRIGSEPLELHRYTDSSGRKTTGRAALEEVKAAIYRREVSKVEQAAVEDYVNRLDKLQVMMDELRAEGMELPDKTLMALASLTSSADRVPVSTKHGTIYQDIDRELPPGVVREQNSGTSGPAPIVLKEGENKP